MKKFIFTLIGLFCILFVINIIFMFPRVPKDKKINEKICVKFENPAESIGDYENIKISTYTCNTNEIIDSYVTQECPFIKYKDGKILIENNYICKFWLTHDFYNENKKDELYINENGFID